LLGIAGRWLGLLFTIKFLVAFFYVKLPAGFNGARLDLMLLVGGLLIFLAGPGRAAVDALWLEEDDRARYQIRSARSERSARKSGGRSPDSARAMGRRMARAK